MARIVRGSILEFDDSMMLIEVRKKKKKVKVVVG